MPIRSARTSQHRRNLAVVLIILTLLSISCSREEAILLNLRSTTEMDSDGEAEMLTVTFSLSLKEEAIQATVEASDQRSRWVVSAAPAKSGVYTIGPLSMGRGVPLSEGEYQLSIMLDDGRLLQERFTVQRP